MSEAILDNGQSTELIPSISIVNLLQRRKEILDRYDKIEALAKELNGLYFPAVSHPDIQCKFSGQHYPNTFGDRYAAQHREEFIKAVDKTGWEYLMNESGNLQLMDAQAKEDWRKNLTDGNYPELTFDNIKATFTELHAKRGDMFDRGVIRCFEGLNPRHKRNDDFKFTKRFTVKYMDSYYASGGAAKLDDLVRIFRVLDGKPELADYNQTIQSKARQYNKKYPFRIENEYMDIIMYKNQNGHVTLKNEKLVKQLNEILFRCYPAHLAKDRFSEEAA